MANNVDYSGVPTVNPTLDGGASYSNVRATSDAFGGQIGEAISGAGKTLQGLSNEAMDYATKVGAQAVEASADDKIVNGFVPAAAKLRADFYQLKGKDALAGQDAYINNLQALREQYTSTARNPYEKQLLNGYMVKHAANEVDGAIRYADNENTTYIKNMGTAFLGMTSNQIVDNYNNPAEVDRLRETGFAKHTMMLHDQGINPDTDEGKIAIDQANREWFGKSIEGGIQRALANNDTRTASTLYAQNKNYIGGVQQIQIEKMLHSETTKQYASDYLAATKSGQMPPPQHDGFSAQEARATTIDVAKSSGVDPNHALTVLRLETSDGQNLGTRGDIGQTGKPASDLHGQAVNMMDELKKSQQVADNALGRPALGWEQYACYQQGEGGGAALLKAANDDPTAKATDVLRPLYKNNYDATTAITHNGGNASMTAGQFLDMIKQKYSVAASQSAMSDAQDKPEPVPNPETPAGIQITQQHAETVDNTKKQAPISLQDGVTPLDKLMKFNDYYNATSSRQDMFEDI